MSDIVLNNLEIQAGAGAAALADRLIQWDNISKMIIEDKKMYKALSNDETGTILLSEWSTDHETQVSIRFPLDVLKKLLLE